MKNKPVILVVDDQLHDILLLEGFLCRQGYEIIQAESGEEALEKLSGNQVDLVLLDVKMPRMSGFEVLTKLRADKRTQRIPVVMITAYKENEARVKAFESGCDDFISKPFDQYEIVARVKSLLRIKFLNDEVDEAREFAESVINTVREPLISMDQDLKVVTANHSFYDTFKVTPEDTIGNFIYDLGNRQWDIPKLRVLFEEILPNDTVFNGYEVEHDFQGIGRKTILLNARQIFRENIGSDIILLAMEDITESKRAEDEVQNLNRELEQRVMERTAQLQGVITKRKQAEEELQKKNAEIEQFIYTASHDLRSPLVTVKTFMGYLEKDMAEGKLEDLAQDVMYINAAADKMKLLLDELVELSRIGRIDKPSIDVSLREVLAETLLSLAAGIRERQVDIRLPDTDLILFGDRQRICQIWQNLIENALKYYRDGSIPSIVLGVQASDEETVFFVKDNGIGIDPKYLEKIFGIFEKIDPKSPGAGMGLSMIQRIVEKCEGRVWAESEGIGKGSCFYFTLPQMMVQD